MLLKLVGYRLARGLTTLWLVSLLIFASTEILPGDVATAILGQSRTPETVAAIRNSLGLNRPAYIRYADWLGHFVRGDIGKSLANQRDIAPEIRERLGNTLFLAGIAACISVPLSILLGLLAAIRHESFFDRLVSAATLATISFPEFFIGYVLIIVFAVKLDWFPSLAMIDSQMGFWARLDAIALPAATLVLVVLAHMMRQTRAAVLNILGHPFIEMAVLKGVPKWRIVLEHAVPNALAPIVNVVALNLAYLVVGVVVVEVVFVYPGMGQLMVDSVAKRDVPVVQTCGLIFALTYVGLNMIADLVGVLSNPRLRHPR
ncbi:MAG: ABC transporter permease [Acidobacteriaceae bacterium]|nr:ABC transporter permease [Acidobacteriaceae bacterium]MBV9404279.1 ABC transporter permease [Acidobacteriaceae bacterium]MBV9755026.1 ABC transporter permease [Hyphomicrobiales bacterium]